MRILTASEMAEADSCSIAEGISITKLMRNAGDAVAGFCLRHMLPESDRDLRIVVLCGKGNNGGDGFVAARVLAAAGFRVRIALLAKQIEVKGDAYAALSTAGRCDLKEITDEASLRAVLEDAGFILDAIVGTGFKPPLRGLAATARDILAETKTPVVAVDLPSGWDADSMEEKSPDAIRANAVVTFEAPKLAHIFGQLTTKVLGPVVVRSIGIPEGAVQSATNLTWAGSAKALTEKPRDANSNKGKFGHVLLVGGAWGKSGAPSMSSLAAMRAGAGLVTAAVPSSILPIVASTALELMTVPLAERDGYVELSNAEPAALEKLLKGIKVIAVGPGLGTEGEASDFARALVANSDLPTVIDADALNAFAGKTELLKLAAQGGKRPIILTPHPGEMARLLGKTVKEVEADRINIARTFATEHDLTLVLKGWRTLIAHPDGRIAVNTTGNPSMAKGGSGDILTGIVAALVAQHPDNIAQAVEAAVFLHGLAGDFAVQTQNEHTVLATDTVAHLANAFNSRVKDPHGFTWISGTACTPRKASS